VNITHRTEDARDPMRLLAAGVPLSLLLDLALGPESSLMSADVVPTTPEGPARTGLA
jgi:hypothetical protein